jgi:4'-phosphopantetheinyl transferase
MMRDGEQATPATPPKLGKTMAFGANPGEIAVWWMELDAPPADVMVQWRSCLDAAEQARADRFHFEGDRETYTAAHWLVRNALASVGGMPPADWRFVVETRGKPAIDPALGRRGLRFNLSHTRGFVACAITFGSEIGIDVETLARNPAGLDIAEHFFSPSEVAILRGVAPDRQRDTFFRLWTLKEAYIKATGEGLSRPLDSFSFALDPVAISFDPDAAAEASQWQFIEQRPTHRHLLALAIRHPAAASVKLSIHPIRATA